MGTARSRLCSVPQHINTVEKEDCLEADAVTVNTAEVPVVFLKHRSLDTIESKCATESTRASSTRTGCTTDGAGGFSRRQSCNSRSTLRTDSCSTLATGLSFIDWLGEGGFDEKEDAGVALASLGGDLSATAKALLDHSEEMSRNPEQAAAEALIRSIIMRIDDRQIRMRRAWRTETKLMCGLNRAFKLGRYESLHKVSASVQQELARTERFWLQLNEDLEALRSLPDIAPDDQAAHQAAITITKNLRKNMDLLKARLTVMERKIVSKLEVQAVAEEAAESVDFHSAMRQLFDEVKAQSAQETTAVPRLIQQQTPKADPAQNHKLAGSVRQDKPAAAETSRQPKPVVAEAARQPKPVAAEVVRQPKPVAEAARQPKPGAEADRQPKLGVEAVREPKPAEPVWQHKPAEPSRQNKAAEQTRRRHHQREQQPQQQQQQQQQQQPQVADAGTGEEGASMVATVSSGGTYILRNATVVQQPGDGSCLFHSLAYGLGGASTAKVLREEVANFLKEHPGLLIADTPLSKWIKWEAGSSVWAHAEGMANNKWGGGVELAACSRLKQVHIHVYERCPSDSGSFRRISCFDCPGATKVINLLYQGGVHYDALAV